jgi:GMP synthase-like glutamine amidotransferase
MTLKTLRVAVLDMYNNRPGQGIRGIKQLLDEFDFPVHVEMFNVRAGNEVPGTDFDIYISSGGPGNPLEQHFPWYEPWVNLMEDLFLNYSGKKFVFLICHSFQIFCHRLKIAEVKLRRSPAFGIFPVHKTVSGSSDRVLSQLPDPFYAVDSRNWQVVQPDFDKLKSIKAEVLCIEKDRPHVNLERACMGIRFSPSFIGFQFHPEADNQGMSVYFRSPQKKREIISNHGEEKYNDMLLCLLDDSKLTRTYNKIIPAFLRDACHHIQ